MVHFLVIVKPEILVRGCALSLLGDFEFALETARLDNIRTCSLNLSQAQDFYSVHRNKAFFSNLCLQMASGPVLAAKFRGATEECISKARDVIGATDSSKAMPGTIRAKYGNPSLIRDNAIHVSSSLDDAAREVSFFFASGLM